MSVFSCVMLNYGENSGPSPKKFLVVINWKSFLLYIKGNLPSLSFKDDNDNFEGAIK